MAFKKKIRVRKPGRNREDIVEKQAAKERIEWERKHNRKRYNY